MPPCDPVRTKHVIEALISAFGTHLAKPYFHLLHTYVSVYMVICAHTQLFIFLFCAVMKEEDAEPCCIDKGLLKCCSMTPAWLMPGVTEALRTDRSQTMPVTAWQR